MNYRIPKNKSALPSGTYLLKVKVHVSLHELKAQSISLAQWKIKTCFLWTFFLIIFLFLLFFAFRLIVKKLSTVLYAFSLNFLLSFGAVSFTVLYSFLNDTLTATSKLFYFNSKTTFSDNYCSGYVDPSDVVTVFSAILVALRQLCIVLKHFLDLHDSDAKIIFRKSIPKRLSMHLVLLLLLWRWHTCECSSLGFRKHVFFRSLGPKSFRPQVGSFDGWF